MSHRSRERSSQISPDVEALLSAALGLAAAGSRSEGIFWESRLALLLDRILESGHSASVVNALEQLNQRDANAYSALVESIEHAAETVRIKAAALRAHEGMPVPAEAVHGLLLSAPIVAWTRFNIPARAVPAEVAGQLVAIWRQQVLAPGISFQMLPWLFSLDQLPHEFADLRKLTRKLAVGAANGTTVRLDTRSMPESAELLADTRFLLGSIVVPDLATPVFRWQLSGAEHRSREQCLEAWVTQCRPLLEPLLPGCGFDCLLPDAYHVNLRESDRLVRVWGIKAAVHFLVHALDIEAATIKAAVAGFGYSRVDEYRIGLSLGDSEEVVQGIVWPLLGPETDTDDPSPLEQIRSTLQEVGVVDIRIWSNLMEPEFCEDCGSPFYPNRSEELVHMQVPEGAEPGSSRFH